MKIKRLFSRKRGKVAVSYPSLALKRRKPVLFIAFARCNYNDAEIEQLRRLGAHDPMGIYEYEGARLPAGLLDRMKEAMNVMCSDANSHELWFIAKKSDMAWIKRAIDFDLVRGGRKMIGNSYVKFINMLKTSCGVPLSKVPEKTALAKYCKKVSSARRELPWIFEDTRDDVETNRRNTI